MERDVEEVNVRAWETVDECVMKDDEMKVVSFDGRERDESLSREKERMA